MFKIGLIGCGGIATALVETLKPYAPAVQICGVLAQRSSAAKVSFLEHTVIAANVEELVQLAPDLVVECASHSAVREYGERILESGIGLVITSIGVLAEEPFRQALDEASKKGGARYYLTSGAIGGLDALRAARLGKLDRVHYRGIKPATSWAGLEQNRLKKIMSAAQPETIYSGNARSAALDYPKNSNVAAAIALEGVGFERTHVELIADPKAQFNTHEISFSGEDCEFHFSIIGRPSPQNPRTSMLTAHAVASTVLEIWKERS